MFHLASFWDLAIDSPKDDYDILHNLVEIPHHYSLAYTKEAVEIVNIYLVYGYCDWNHLLHYSESPIWSPSRDFLEWSVKKIFVSPKKILCSYFFSSHK